MPLLPTFLRARLRRIRLLEPLEERDFALRDLAPARGVADLP